MYCGLSYCVYVFVILIHTLGLYSHHESHSRRCHSGCNKLIEAWSRYSAYDKGNIVLLLLLLLLNCWLHCSWISLSYEYRSCANNLPFGSCDHFTPRTRVCSLAAIVSAGWWFSSFHAISYTSRCAGVSYCSQPRRNSISAWTYFLWLRFIFILAQQIKRAILMCVWERDGLCTALLLISMKDFKNSSSVMY